jgi:hypothetical protein
LAPDYIEACNRKYADKIGCINEQITFWEREVERLRIVSENSEKLDKEYEWDAWNKKWAPHLPKVFLGALLLISFFVTIARS